MGTEKPTLSVLIPNHNHGPYLADCLNSFLTQSWAPDEIVVVDDSSTDDSWQIAAQFARLDSRIRLFRNPRRLGVMPTLNRALQEARCDYVYGGAADDRVLPGAFARAMSLLEKHPRAGLCFGHTLTLNPQTGHVSEHPLGLAEEARLFMPHQLAEAMERRAVPGHSVAIPGNGAIWKRSEHLRCGGYREELKWHADWFALQVIGMRHSSCFVPAPLAINRVDRASFSLAGQECWESQQAVLNSLLKLLTGDEFRDVWPLFRTGRLLSQFAPWVARVVAGNESHWTEQHALLVENSLLHFHRQLFDDGNPIVRQGAAVCLGLLGGAAVGAIAALSWLQTDPHFEVRQAAATARGAIRRRCSALSVMHHAAVGTAVLCKRAAARRLKQWLRPVAGFISAGTDRRVMVRMNALDSQHRRLVAGLQAEIRALRSELSELKSGEDEAERAGRICDETERIPGCPAEPESRPLPWSGARGDERTDLDSGAEAA